MFVQTPIAYASHIIAFQLKKEALFGSMFAREISHIVGMTHKKNCVVQHEAVPLLD